ncbi:MAG: SusC/RagA family TonB-linked outer membrane protein [Bacteroidales bacterium]|nr:SusC/RagA family TonB-linked outer membrane protein [Bacteroidales bacterium]
MGPLIGVNVLEKGTTNGCFTDFEGNFSLTVPADAILVVSYLGYETVEVSVGGRARLDVLLAPDSELLEEVVVTALGIKRATKALSYNVQEVKSDEVTRVKDANFVNSLNGKVAGLTINSSSSGVGGISKVVMRGTKSIMQSSNALYVIDGVPMYPASQSGGTEFDSKGATEPIADINPEDIESMTVLTGAAAAALYGSAAANGAVVVTTKRGQQGRTSVTVTSNTEVFDPFVMPKFQNRYGTSASDPTRSWGNRLNESNSYGYNPKSDYFRTGVTATESVALSTGTEKNQTYLSAAAVNSDGYIPNNGYERYNFTFRNTTSFLNDKMTLDVGATYVIQKDRNMVNQGVYSNPLVGAYLFPRGDDWNDIKMYERYDATRKLNTQYWPVGDAGMTMQNPYWINYRQLRENKKNRYMLNASLSYQILDWLNVAGRVRVDNSTNTYTQKYYAGTNTQLTESSNRGYYGDTESSEKQLYADVLVNINKTWGDWSLAANLGASITDMRGDELAVTGPIADETFVNETPGLANVFNVQNLSSTQTKRVQSGWREQTQSVFGSVEVGFMNAFYLTVTGRNDWPSQLAGPNSTKKSFFYPSVGLSVVVSQLINNLNPNGMSFLKVRGSFASVGTAFQRYIANPRYEWNSSTNQWSNTTQYPVYNLKPERTESWEAGLTIRFLKYFNLDATYYNTTTKNQTFNPELGVSGYSALYIQTGAVRNSGVELALGFEDTWNKFTWASNYTFSTNKNKILSLADNAINPVTGEQFSISTLNMGGLGSVKFLLREGGTMGDIYSNIDMQRDANGNIYVDDGGNVYTETISSSDSWLKLGSVLPKANMAWRNTFSFYNFNIGFMITARFGGVAYSRTQAMLDNYGVSAATADARDLGYVLVNGTDRVNPESWYRTIGNGDTVPQYYTYSATNVRLSEASIGYTFPRKMMNDVCELTLSVVGRNLFMIYCKAPFDPESVASTDNFYQGVDYFMMPSTRNVGFSLTLKF